MSDILANGYFGKKYYGSGRKVYFGNLMVNNTLRMSKKQFRTAQSAHDYSKRLATRAMSFFDYCNSIKGAD